MLKIYQFVLKEWFMLMFTITLAGLFFYNKHMYDNRHDGYLFTDAANYNELYFSEESYKIKNFSALTSDSLKLIISPVPQKTTWTITNADGKSYNLKAVELPIIKLKEGINTYTIASEIEHQCLKTNTITIEYLPKDNYTFIINSTIPILETQLFPINRWTKLSASISENEISETKKIIKDQIKINDSLPTIEKIKLISLYLVNQLRKSEGAPFGNMKQQTPLTQFKLACSNQNKVDCAIYSDVFHLFANCAEIPTRKIGLNGYINNFVTSGHVFNECYIKEQGKWAFVDLTSKKIVVTNSQQEVLNTVDLLNTINAKDFGNKSAVILNDSTKIDTVAYSSVNQSEINYLKPSVCLYVINETINENMNFKESFNEYLSTKSHYGTYYINTIKVDNHKHYYKIFIYKTSLAIFMFWGLYMTIKIILFFKKRLITQ